VGLFYLGGCHFFFAVHLLYTYIIVVRKGVGKMRRNHRKYDSRDRLIQYAIEIFDLVELNVDADSSEPVRRRFVRSNTKRYDGTKRLVSHVDESA
jgi:hypothetical protein